MVQADHIHRLSGRCSTHGELGVSTNDEKRLISIFPCCAVQEHLFDVSDLQHEPPLISKCGSLEVTFTYDSTKSKMVVHIHRAREIPAKDRGGANSTQVRMDILEVLIVTACREVEDSVDVVFAPLLNGWFGWLAMTTGIQAEKGLA